MNSPNSSIDNLEFVLGLQKQVGNPVLFCFCFFPLLNQPVFQDHLLNNPSILSTDVKYHHHQILNSHFYTGRSEFSFVLLLCLSIPAQVQILYYSSSITAFKTQ